MKLPFTKQHRHYERLGPWDGICTYDYTTREYITTFLGLNLIYALGIAIVNWAKCPRAFLDRDELMKRARWAEDETREERRIRYIYYYRLQLHDITTETGDEDPFND